MKKSSRTTDKVGERKAVKKIGVKIREPTRKERGYKNNLKINLNKKEYWNTGPVVKIYENIKENKGFKLVVKKGKK